MNHQKSAVLAVLQDGLKHDTKQIANYACTTSDTATTVLRRLVQSGIAVQVHPAIKAGKLSTPAVWKIEPRFQFQHEFELRQKEKL
jgi:hypothetical protein